MLNLDCDGTMNDAGTPNDRALLWQMVAWHCVRTAQHVFGTTTPMARLTSSNTRRVEPTLDTPNDNGLAEDAEVIRDLADRLMAERGIRPQAPRLTALGLVLVVLVMGSLAAASLLPVVKFPGDAGNYLGHLVAYGLATGCLMVLAKLRPWLAALMLFAFGIAIEFIQPTVGRETHIEDVLANTLGIVTAWCLVAFWRRLTMRRRVTSTRVDW